MASRGSHRPQDEIVWQTTALPVGSVGLDLRDTVTGLTKALNARFESNKIIRRNGYRKQEIRDSEDYPIFRDALDNPVSGPINPTGWVYGHGQLLDQSNPLATEIQHIPEPHIARGTFRLGNQDVLWTGDRLLVVRDGQPALGESTFWDDGSDIGVTKCGIPAYLPVQTELTTPEPITGDYVETCVTDSVRVVVAGSTDPTVWIVDRETGAVVNKTTLTGDGNSYDLRVFASGAYIVLLWRTASRNLYISHWAGLTWATPTLVTNQVYAYDVALEDGGFHVVWHSYDGVNHKLFAGHYSGYTPQVVPYVFGTELTVTVAPTGPIACDIDPAGRLAVVWQGSGANGLNIRVWESGLTPAISAAVLHATNTWNGGLTVRSRALSDSYGTVKKYRWVVYAASGTTAQTFEFDTVTGVIRSDTRYNTDVASKAFRVGNEVFCWLRATNSSTLYLVAGAQHPMVCGIADREIAYTRTTTDGVRSISQVTNDPRDEYVFVWARPFNTGLERQALTGTFATGRTYARGGNVLIGSLNFLTTLSTAKFGASIYVAGSHVRNWDGVQLGDCGFHDYPKASGTPSASGGSLSTGDYRFRVYAVRYNAKGERFESAAITSSIIPVTGPSGSIQVTINTLPCTNHDDVMFEVFRTQAGGTTYYLDGFIANTFSAATVVYTSTASDTTIGTRVADAHAPGVGIAGTLEDFGPVGCAFLATAGDRLWGAGGQIPSGWALFSKLKTNYGAGFDAIAGAQQIDTQGGEVNSITGFGDAVLFFQADKLQAVNAASGPDNYGSGSFGVPHTALADGAVNHVGTASTPIGVVYWGVDGPRLLDASLTRVDQICAPVRVLTKNLTPTGVQVDLDRQEVVWYTADGDAMLWNYIEVESQFNKLTSLGRWSQWSGLKIAGCSEGALATTDGRMLYEDEDAYGDAGVPFTFAGATGQLSPEKMLNGGQKVRKVGLTGEYLGDHQLRVRVFYNHSPLWGEQWEWEPTTETGLQAGTAFANLTAAQIDALTFQDKSGQYATHKRVKREDCRTFSVEWSDMGAFRPTYKLHELSFELGVRAGLGRVPVNTF